MYTITATCSAINKKENVLIKKKKEKENKLFFKKGRKNPLLTFILYIDSSFLFYKLFTLH